MVNLTTKWALPLFVDTDVFDPIQTPLGLMSTATEAGISKAYAMGLPTVASAAERDAIYPTVGLMQGVGVYRSDLGYEERYYGLYNSTTNPGGRATAGWAPIRPSSYRATGSAGGLTPAAVVACAFNLPAGTWRVDATAVFDFSTASPHRYTVDIFNSATALAVVTGPASSGVAVGALTTSIFDIITLTTPTQVSLRVYSDATEGAQNCQRALLLAARAELPA